jgi:hypothetical protein
LSLASLTDIADRKGRELTVAETRMATLLVDEADAAIAAAADVAVSALDATVDPVLAIIARDLVLRSMANPEGVTASREQLGAYAVSRTYGQTDDGSSAGMRLSEREVLLVRRVIHGTNTAGVHVDSLGEQLDCDLVTGQLLITSDTIVN